MAKDPLMILIDREIEETLRHLERTKHRGRWRYDPTTQTWQPTVREYKGPSGAIYITEPGGEILFDEVVEPDGVDYLHEAMCHVVGVRR